MSAVLRAHQLQGAPKVCKGSAVHVQASQVSHCGPHTSIQCATACSATGSAVTWFVPSTAARSRTQRCNALPNSSSDVTGAVASGYGRADPAPYKWSWQDDVEPSTTVQLDTSAVAGADSITDLVSLLQTAAAGAPPRAVLSPASRSALDAAVAQLLPRSAGGPAAGTAAVNAAGAQCTVADAARLLGAYGTLMQGAGSSAAPSTSTARLADSGPPATAAGAEAASRQDSGAAASSAAPPLVLALLAHVCCGGAPLVASASARDLADLLWAIAELQEELPWDGWQAPAAAARSQPHDGASSEPSTSQGSDSDAVRAVPAALQRAVLARLRDQDFLAPDLCRAVCALGSLAMATRSSSAATAPADSSSSSPASSAREGTPAGSSSSSGLRLDPDLVSALNEEIRFQLTEFSADFEAADLGRLVSGMWGLRLGAAVAGDQEYHRVLMKAVYGKTRSLVDKAAVDFALSRLLEDDPEARSMHYDSRWTHEELRWLPRRERDKRRIIKEGWYRTQWGGWAPGGN